MTQESVLHVLDEDDTVLEELAVKITRFPGVKDQLDEVLDESTYISDADEINFVRNHADFEEGCVIYQEKLP